VRIAKEELSKLGNLKLVPGMPAEVFVNTGERTALSYLMKPLTDSLSRSFKDG
jgi:HlyD family secretion protein